MVATVTAAPKSIQAPSIWSLYEQRRAHAESNRERNHRSRETATCVRVGSIFRPQHGPGGMGDPWGQVRGCPRNVQILSVASDDRMCSNLQACCSISVSLSI